MDAGPDAQQGANKSDVDTTYHVDVWLPDESESGYPELSDASKEVKTALDKELADVQRKNNGIEIRFEHKRYKRDTKNLDIDGRSVAAISFSEDFAEQCNSNDVAVLAMMGGVLPVGKSFFRMGFSVETIAAILGDQIIKDGRVSHVFLIRVDNNLGNEFERAFSRAVNAPSPERSLDILKIDENGTPITTKIQITQTDEKVVRNTPTNEGVISKWLKKRPRNQGLRSVVIYGYWEQYWDIVKEVLRWEGFDKKTDWLYVESNYPLLTPVLRNMQSGGDLTNIVEIEEADKLNVKDSESDRIQVDFGQIPSKEKGDNGKIKSNLNPSDTQGSVEETVDDTHKTKGFKDKTKKLTEDAHVQGLGRVRCFTGKLVERESSFITFAKETVRLLCAAIRYAHDQLEKENKQEDVEEEIIRRRRRERICEFLVRSKFYASEHLGSFFFRKDGELFFPLYHYNGKLERQGIVRESCCKGDEFTKEAIADQLLQLSNSLNKITRAEIPRNLKVGNSDGAKKVFEEFSKIIADISKGIEIKFVSYYPNTERLFYTWTDTQEGNVDKTERFINVSIFDDVCKKIQGVIQINLKDFDLEDNDAYRVYLVYERAKNIFDVLTLAEWWNRQYDALRSKILDGNEGWESGIFPVKAVVFTKSRIRKQDGQTWEGLSEDEYKNIIGKAKYVHYYRDDHGSKFEFDEILRGLCQLLDCRQDPSNSKSTTDSKSNAGFLYYIPEYVLEDDNSSKTSDAGDGQGGIVMTTCCKLSLFDLQIIENMVSRIFSKLKTCLAEHDVLLSNIKSAIGSIMSRNGSHNIGSHVLAALSHNVGTMPDDRLLYQYIQHRMDYIATATTDFPTWSGETKLVNGLIRRFLSQRHLLDHIAGSEGLHSFKFQDPNVSGRARREQTDTIKLHIRRKDTEGTIISDFITEDNETNGGSVVDKLKNDISVAMPGGVIGAHAFFTILENVIRNAAKHGWARQKDDKQNQDVKAENLDIYVDFVLDDDGKSITVTIFDNISDVFSVFDGSMMTANEKEWLNKYRNNLKDDKEGDEAKDKRAAVVDFLAGKGDVESLPDAYKEQHKILSARTPEELKDIADRLMGEVPSDGSIGNRLWLPLHHSQDIKLRQSFIDDAGTLRRENWGLAEMKISAGYLNKRSISEIGGITEGLPIVTPVCVEQQETFKGKDNQVPKSHLGYQFKIPRPREIAFVCDRARISQAKIDQLQTLGIFVTPVPEEMKFFKPKNEGDTDWNYSYVVLPSFPEQENPHLPFRVLVKDKSGCKCPDMVPGAAFYDTIVARLQSDESAETIAESLKKEVYRTWIDYWCKKRGFGVVDYSTRPPLRIMPTEESDSGRSNQGLVSNYEVWDFVFKEMFRSIVGDLLQKADAGEFFVAEDVYWYLAILAVMPKSLGENGSVFTFKDEDDALRAKINDDKTPIDNLGRELIFNQLSKWFSEFESIDNSPDDGDSLLAGMLPFAKNYSLKLRGLNLPAMSGDEIKHRIVSMARTMQEIVADCVATSYFEFKPGNKLYVHEGNKANGMIRFVNNMCSAYREADVMLRKYEERIVSLPAFLSESQDKKESRGKEEIDRIEIEHDFERRLKEGEGGGISLYYGKTSTNWDGRAIVFQRHAKPVDYNYERMLYFEPLSGTQSYLYEFMQLPQSDSADQILTRMYETGLSRVLIVDERVSKFLRSRPDEIKTFCRMGIWCVDEAKFGVAKKIDNKEKAPPIEMLDSLIEFDKEKFDSLINAAVGEGEPSQVGLICNEVRERERIKFDILIIHQGLIDKWLPQAETNSKRVEAFIQVLRRFIPYVVITTGRGTPANTPDSARILPFPVVEATLFKKYPEKMVLVDTIMNILPIGAH